MKDLNVKQLTLRSNGLEVELLTADGRNLIPDLMAKELSVKFSHGNTNELTIKIDLVRVEAALPLVDPEIAA